MHVWCCFCFFFEKVFHIQWTTFSITNNGTKMIWNYCFKIQQPVLKDNRQWPWTTDFLLSFCLNKCRSGIPNIQTFCFFAKLQYITHKFSKSKIGPNSVWKCSKMRMKVFFLFLIRSLSTTNAKIVLQWAILEGQHNMWN